MTATATSAEDTSVVDRQLSHFVVVAGARRSSVYNVNTAVSSSSLIRMGWTLISSLLSGRRGEGAPISLINIKNNAGCTCTHIGCGYLEPNTFNSYRKPNQCIRPSISHACQSNPGSILNPPHGMHDINYSSVFLFVSVNSL